MLVASIFSGPSVARRGDLDVILPGTFSRRVVQKVCLTGFGNVIGSGNQKAADKPFK